MAFTRLLSRRQFPLAQFDLAPLAFELGHAGGEEQVETTAQASHPITPGEMRESIERHLSLVRPKDDSPLLEQDAVDELREAIAELRRSIG